MTTINNTNKGITEFDPSTTPRYPIIKGSWDEDHATLDGIELDATGGGREAVIDALAARAASRPGELKAFRALIQTPDGLRTIVVNQDGQAWDLTPPPPVRKRDPRVLIGLAAAALVLPLAAGAFFLVGANRSDDAEPAPSPPAAPSAPGHTAPTLFELPQAPSPGWSAQALWRSDELPSRPATIVAGDLVVTSTQDGLAGWRVQGGERAWSRSLDAADQSREWALARDGKSLVGLGRDALVRVPLSGEGDVARAALPDHLLSPVLATDGTGIAVTSSSREAYVLDGNELRPRTAPAGATVLGAVDTTGVAADTLGRVWTMTEPTVASAPRSLPTPAPGATPVAPVRLDGATLVYEWLTKDKKGTLLALYEAPSMRLRASTTLPGRTDITGKDYRTSPDGTWAIAGRYALPTAPAKGQSTVPATDLGDGWHTDLLLNDRAFSTSTSGTPLAAAKLRRASSYPEVKGGYAQPFGLVDSTLLVVAKDGSRTRVYALGPESSTDAPPAPPTPTTSTPSPARKPAARTTAQPAAKPKTSAAPAQRKPGGGL